MKKIILFSVSLFIALCLGVTCVFAAQYTKFSRQFIKNFKDCDSYEETITTNFQGSNFTTFRKIIGWRNGFCRYQEVISSAEGKYKLNCMFTDVQLDELYNSMKNKSKKTETYNLELFSTKVDEKTGKTDYVKTGSTVIKGNKAYIVWAKYQNNPYFCTPEKL